MSRNTKKANAALTGLGKARRVILGDTLVAQFSENEIRAVFAHELGHYRLGHLPKQMLFSGVSTFAAMGFAGWLYAALAGRFGFQGITDIAATPVLALVLMLYGLVTIPLGNWWSRRHEWQADDYALETTQDPAAYITCMEKLRDLNLADPAPHPWIERLFHSHPSIGKRIAHARNFQAGMTD